MSSYWRNKSEIVQAVSTEKAMTKLTSPTSKTSTSHNVILDSDAVPVLCVLFEHYIFILEGWLIHSAHSNVYFYGSVSYYCAVVRQSPMHGNRKLNH